MQDLAREISLDRPSGVRYSFCTLVTKLDEYSELLANLQEHGFSDSDCEFLYVDNSQGNGMDAFAAYNRFLLTARGEYVVLCHQDILLLAEGRAELDGLLLELTLRDPSWGVCGNAGASERGDCVCRITDPGGTWALGGPFPQKVVGLDENFIVTRRCKNLAASHDLQGFHWYGSDLCRIAEILGCTCYVIDFHLLHKSLGKVDQSFHCSRKAFAAKYGRVLKGRWQHVTTEWSTYLGEPGAESLAARLAWEARKRLSPPALRRR